MINSKILCLVPTLPEDLNLECERAILSQTVHVDKIIFAHYPVRGGTLANRVSYVLNRGLEGVNLNEYDFLLRVDCDTVLPSDYLEKALKDAPDLAGNSGYAMLIRVKPFMELMDGKFNSESDDGYIIHRFRFEGLKVNLANDIEIVTRQIHEHSKRDQMACGTIYYKLGYEPLHVLFFLFRNRAWGNKMRLLVLGYFISLLKHEKKFDFAPHIWTRQIQRLIRR